MAEIPPFDFIIIGDKHFVKDNDVGNKKQNSDLVILRNHECDGEGSL